MEEDKRMFQVRKTVLEMLADRQYLITQEERDLNLEQFRAQFCKDGAVTSRENLVLLKRKVDFFQEQIFVFFPDEVKVGVKTITKYNSRMNDEGVTRSILVVQQGVTPFARNAMQAMQPAITFEEFKEAELLINITKHVLVPRHVVLSKEEKATLLQRYRCKETQLPRMQLHDPVAKYYGLQRGQVVKILRPSETAGRYITYRLVI
eukprot:TRINITY_DN7337_c0_g1_i2.p1 TRINITY_DN7337_c0_g1~~TRINITY_DN7337_c0_g1_i2.p1  ORF type:complete len:206 (+),score=41.48 TRINITY_DN7337_c0_g1_i2:90-707(+)